MTRKISTFALASFAALTTVGSIASAAVVDPGLPGNHSYDGWLSSNLTAAANPGFPTFFTSTNPWPNAIGSGAPGSGDATLNKLANGTGGGPYPAGGSIYHAGFSGDQNVNGGTLGVTDATPLADVKNVVFQVEIGEATLYDFYNHVKPVLSYNGGTQNLVADNLLTISKVFNGTITMPTGEEPIYINTWLLQWDLSSIAEPITNLQVKFTSVQHAQVYALRLDQYDTYEATAVPEPTAIAGLALTGGAALLRRRVRCTA